MSTFNCLGFHLENEQGFRILIDRALRFGRIVRPEGTPEVPEGHDGADDAEGADENDILGDDEELEQEPATHCVLWRLKSGIEVWVLRDADDNVVGCNPHLRSKLVCPADVIPENEGIALVSCESFRVHAEIPNLPFLPTAEGAAITVNLSMFTKDIAACDPGTVKLTAEPGDDPLLVRFTGPIENATLATNSDTDTQFGTVTLLLGDTAKLLLAVDLTRVKKMPLEGWVTGTGYLSAALPSPLVS